MDDSAFRQLLTFFNLSWTGYRKVRRGVKKRINRHMAEIGVADFTAYHRQLTTHKESYNECRRRLAVPISRFFRDRQVWRDLENHHLPALAVRFPGPIRVWSAGCAGGEEVYTLKIIWDRLRPPARLEIIATDLNPQCLARAQQGIYPMSSLKEVTEDDRRRCFSPTANGRRFRIRHGLRGDIQWIGQDLLSEIPGGCFHIILLRNNLLTYHQEATRRQILAKILDVLVPGGLLVVGCHEKIPHGFPQLVPWEGNPLLYTRTWGEISRSTK